MPPTNKRDFGRLAKLARRRHADLGLAMNNATAKAAGTSKGTWQRVEKGLPIRETNYVKIDGLLRWTPGSSITVLDGGDPTPLPEELEDGGMPEGLCALGMRDDSGILDHPKVREIMALDLPLDERIRGVRIFVEMELECLRKRE